MKTNSPELRGSMKARVAARAKIQRLKLIRQQAEATAEPPTTEPPCE